MQSRLGALTPRCEGVGCDWSHDDGDKDVVGPRCLFVAAGSFKRERARERLRVECNVRDLCTATTCSEGVDEAAAEESSTMWLSRNALLWQGAGATGKWAGVAVLGHRLRILAHVQDAAAAAAEKSPPPRAIGGVL